LVKTDISTRFSQTTWFGLLLEIEQFLTMLRFENRSKLEVLPVFSSEVDMDDSVLSFPMVAIDKADSFGDYHPVYAFATESLLLFTSSLETLITDCES
jgi:hypothetical protein